MDGDVAGFELVELIGFGVLGDVWKAVDGGSGQVVALRRLTAPDALEEVRRRSALLRSMTGEHVIRVRSVTDAAVVLDHAPAGSLAALLSRRGRLTPGEAVTVVAPVALAIAEAHLRGLAHGRISAREVLLTREGKPRLDGLALSFLYDAEPSQAGDVRALARLARDLLDGVDLPEPMQRAVSQALDPDAPITAADFGHALLGACRAEPLAGLGEPEPPLLLRAPPPAPELPRDRRRWSVGAGLLAVLLVAALAASWLHTRERAPRTPPVSVTSDRPTTSAQDDQPESGWGQMLERLDQARAAAFAADDPLALAQVYVPGSSALRAEQLAMARLAAAHLTVRGLRHVTLSLHVLRLSPLQAELEVWQSLSAYQLEGVDGRVRQQRAGPRVQRVVALRRTSEGWRVERTRV